VTAILLLALLVSRRYSLQFALALLQASLQGVLNVLQFSDLLLDRRQFLVQEFFDMRARRYMLPA